MRKIELLSPAKDIECGMAAINHGADAIYIGAQKFGARAAAGNSTSDIEKLAKYAHKYNANVYVTVNTILKDSEIEDARQLITELYEAGADALIVQDLGLVRQILQQIPDLMLHASTQLTVHNLDGILFAQQMGFDRVVLSREVSRKELEYMALRSPLELEIFGHGALCMCYSGQCYMSSLIGNRSGNRGECAQPCRLPYQDGYRLSLKDLCLLKYYNELEKMGIASLKIEGRMKSPEYVASITGAYAAAKRGEAYTPEKEEYLAGVFSRSGFTDGYYTDQIGPSMFGTRSETVNKVDLPIKEYPRLSLDVSIHPTEDGLLCTARCGSYSAEGILPVSEARSRATEESEIQDAFGALGNTAYYLNSFAADLPENSFVPVSAVKSLRRDLIDRLTQMRCLVSHSWKELPVTYEPCKPFSGRREGFFLHPDRIPQKVDLDFLWLPLTAIQECPKIVSRYSDRIGFVLPRILRADEKQQAERLVSAWKEAGVFDALCGNVGHLPFCFAHGLTPHGDFGLNVYNPVTRDELLKRGCKDVTLSFELNGAQLRDMTTPRTGMIVYGRLPFMIFRNCLKKHHGKEERLTDRIGKEFLLTCSFGCRNELWNADPLWLADKPIEGLGFQRFLFTDETPEQITEVLSAYRQGRVPASGMTRGRF